MNLNIVPETEIELNGVYGIWLSFPAFDKDLFCTLTYTQFISKYHRFFTLFKGCFAVEIDE